MSFPAAIVLDRVTKVYDEAVVSDVSLDVQEGTFVTLLGPSGAGKTTILQMIGGFVQPSCGAQALSSREAERRWACRARNADWLARMEGGNPEPYQVVLFGPDGRRPYARFLGDRET